MRKRFFLSSSFVLIAMMAITSCSSVSFTTVSTPKPTKQMLVTSGDLPNKNYEVIGFVESNASVMGFGLPTESKISEIKSNALNSGFISKAESIGADAIINVTLSTISGSAYLFLSSTNISVKGTAIKFK